MDGAIGYSYTGFGNGVVVVIFGGSIGIILLYGRGNRLFLYWYCNRVVVVM